jgi:Peptidase C13 family
MSSFLLVLKLASRAGIWRTTRLSRLVGLPSLLAWLAALGVLRILIQLAEAGLGAGFNPYGLNAIVAWLALEAAVAALFVPPAARSTALSAMFAVTLVGEAVFEAVKFGAPFIPATAIPDPVWRERAVPLLLFACISVWWVGATAAILRSFSPQPKLVAFGRMAGLWLALAGVTAAVPLVPIFVPGNFDMRDANWWEMLTSRLTDQTGAKDQTSPTAHSQGALLAAETAELAPTVKGATNIYALGIAGWADQDVFVKELDGGLAAMGDIFPIRGRTLRLINDRSTAEHIPLATDRNFIAAVQAIGKVMNKADDVLLLLMTSHGEHTGFALKFPNENASELTPQFVAATLNNEGIKNRIVIVSACFSGVFVSPLANDDTIVLTAADALNTSFGCAPERDWTYFGDAFFRQSIRRGRDLQHTFENARLLISGWEMMDRAKPSNPQAHFGPALVAKLEPFFRPDASAGAEH